MRDSKGRFIRGHKPLNPQDKTTGRFIKKPMDQLSVEEQVDIFLKELENVYGADFKTRHGVEQQIRKLLRVSYFMEMK